MRKNLTYSTIAMSAAVVAAAVVWFAFPREPSDPVGQILAAYQEGAPHGELTITSPLDQTLFPPEVTPPTFRWKSPLARIDTWLVTIEFSDGGDRLNVLCSTDEWTPTEEQWQIVRSRSLEKAARVTVLGVQGNAGGKILCAASISISTSKDEVGAPILYREVNLPFIDAVKDPTRIRWRFGEISSPTQPPVVLENLPVCGNCHSFSADGRVFGMDIDYANDRGSYVIVPVAPEMVLDKSKIITWADYKREDGRLTFGLLSQVSPDGRYVVSTVKDLSVFVARKELAFSQLFFPIQGILAIYDRTTKRFDALPGADDPELVQSNANWSPDGKHIVFARTKAYRLKRPRKAGDAVLLAPDECREFLDGQQGFQFDLYRVPFNGGKGGKAEPLAGASANGMSNYFPKYSPDGKWIVFCKARNFMLLQQDSQLWIIPASGGEARKLQCNLDRMNSWHSWSPNGRWLVFSSKTNSPYTQLFLTHVDEQGNTSPAVLLSRFTSSDRAANIPEFVHRQAGAITRIHEKFVDDHSYLRAGVLNAKQGFYDAAAAAFQKALELNPNRQGAHASLGVNLMRTGRLEEAKEALLKELQLTPNDAEACYVLGGVLAQLRQREEAVKYYRRALEINPKFELAHIQLGILLVQSGSPKEAKTHLAEAVRLNPDHVVARYNLATILLGEGSPREAAVQYRLILDREPNHVLSLRCLAMIRAASEDAAIRNGKEAIQWATKGCDLTRYQDPLLLDVLGMAYAESGRFSDAVSAGQAALRLLRASGDKDQADAIERRLRLYQQNRPFRQVF